MNAKAIPATLAPGHTDPPLDGSAASQVAMVVMLVPIPTPTTGVSAARLEPTPPTYVDSHDHVWLLVDKASPMAAVFEQLTAAESVAMPENNHHQVVAKRSTPASPEPSAAQKMTPTVAILKAKSVQRNAQTVLRSSDFRRSSAR